MLEVFSYLFTKKANASGTADLSLTSIKQARHMALRHKKQTRLFFSLMILTEEPDGQTLVEEVIRQRNGSDPAFVHGRIKTGLPGGSLPDLF